LKIFVSLIYVHDMKYPALPEKQEAGRSPAGYTAGRGESVSHRPQANLYYPTVTQRIVSVSAVLSLGFNP
jgi:hypothetical protein